MRRQTVRKENAFTLVELLVVISVIAILIAMLLPAVIKAKEATYIAVCASQQRQMYIATAAYAADCKEELPPGSYYGLMAFSFGTGPMLARDYNLTTKLVICPAQRHTREGSTNGDMLSQFYYRPKHPAATTGLSPTTMSVINYCYFGGFSDVDTSENTIAANPALPGIPNDHAYWYGWSRRWGLLPVLNKVGPTVYLNSNRAYRKESPEYRPLFWDPAWIVGDMGNNWQGITPLPNHAGNRTTRQGADGNNITYADGHTKWNTNFSTRYASGMLGGNNYFGAVTW